MNYAYLGRTGLKVSRLALGTMNCGELTDEAASFSIMDEALDAGINFFDTADVYGGPQSPDMEKGFGISEEIIGRWLAQGGRRAAQRHRGTPGVALHAEADRQSTPAAGSL
jgi:aryl-alcohol dehydrogenase-like predicted oxidoreductase